MRLLLLLLFPIFVQGQIVDRFTHFASGFVSFDNAADPFNEVNGVAGTDDNSGDFTITSETSFGGQSPTDGTYMLAIECNIDTSSDEYWYVQLVGVNSGDDVTFYVDEQELQGQWAMQMHTSFGWASTVTTNFTGSGWQSFTVSGTADEDDPTVRFRRSSSGAGTDDQMLADNMYYEVTN